MDFFLDFLSIHNVIFGFNFIRSGSGVFIIFQVDT